MNNDILLQNIIYYCATLNVAPKTACRESGAGEKLVQNIQQGSSPRVSSLAKLASYLGVSTSDLVGDAVNHIAPTALPPPPSALDEVARQLNEAGQRELLRYAKYLTTNDEYIKSPASKLG